MITTLDFCGNMSNSDILMILLEGIHENTFHEQVVLPDIHTNTISDCCYCSEMKREPL